MAHAGQVIDLGASGVRITITKSAADTTGRYSQFESRMDGGGKLPTLAHLHPSQVEKIEVLEGSLTMLLDGKVSKHKQGDVVTIPPYQLHNFWNADKEPVRIRVEHWPELNIQGFLETLGLLVQQGNMKYDGSFSDKLQMAVVVTHFKRILVLPPPISWVIKLLAIIGKLAGKKLPV